MAALGGCGRASAIAVSGLAALAVGALSLRTKGFFFLMVTLAFGQMIFFAFHDTKIGGGTDGAFLSRPVISFMDWQLPLTRRHPVDARRPKGVPSKKPGRPGDVE